MFVCHPTRTYLWRISLSCRVHVPWLVNPVSFIYRPRYISSSFNPHPDWICHPFGAIFGDPITKPCIWLIQLILGNPHKKLSLTKRNPKNHTTTEHLREGLFLLSVRWSVKRFGGAKRKTCKALMIESCFPFEPVKKIVWWVPIVASHASA